MSTSSTDSPTDPVQQESLRDEMRRAAELLERIIVNRGLLLAVPPDEQKRLLEAVKLVYHPDAKARRDLVKATTRQRKAAIVNRDDTVLRNTGIRSLRRQSVFNTPNIFPP